MQLTAIRSLTVALAVMLGMVGCRLAPFATRVAATSPQTQADPITLAVTPPQVEADRFAAASAGTGTLKLMVRWPDALAASMAGYRAQQLPDSTVKVAVTIKNGTTTVGSATIVRAQGEATTSAAIKLKVASGLDVTVKAQPATTVADGTACTQDSNCGSGSACSQNQCVTRTLASSTATVTIVKDQTSSLSVTLAPSFSPTITGIDPTSIQGGSTVTITGTNLKQGWASGPTVTFATSGGTTVASGSDIVVDSDTQLSVLVPAAAVAGDLFVSLDGLSSGTASYTVGSGGGVGFGDPGTLTYTGTPVSIAPAASLTVPGGGNLTGFLVSISNKQSGDVLACTPSGGVSCTYSPTTGVLTMAGNASVSTYQTVVQTVTYTSTNPTPPSGNRTIVFNIGGSLFNPGNGHFYEVVATGMTWVNAKASADGKTLYGLQGYLATVTSAVENTFIRSKLAADAWIGASDRYTVVNTALGSTVYANQSAAENHWYWVTGPERGTQFWNGVALGGNYNAWDPGEPNNWGGSEDFAHFYTSYHPGTWNDYVGTQLINSVVEYGGMPGDPNVGLTGEVTVSVP